MNISLDLKITEYLDDSLPSQNNGVYKTQTKVYKGVSGVTDILGYLIDYFSEITVDKDITFSGDSLSITESTTADNNLDQDSIKGYFEDGLKSVANKYTNVVRLGFDNAGNIVPQFGGKPKYVAAVYATITE